MFNTITTQKNYYFPNYQNDNIKNKTKPYRYQQSTSAFNTVTELSVSLAENRFAKIPEKMPYQHHPMTQISSSLIDSLPIVENFIRK